MNRDSRLSHRFVHALLAGAFAWLLWPSAGPLAQDDAAPATNTASAAPAEGAPQSRRDRRRATKAEAAAADAETQTAGAAASTVSGGDAEAVVESEIVCKNIKPLGTRMAKRVCGTPAQWAALEKKTTDAASDDMRQVRGQGAVIATTPGPAVGPP
jgi:hypothetical protein